MPPALVQSAPSEPSLEIQVWPDRKKSYRDRARAKQPRNLLRRAWTTRLSRFRGSPDDLRAVTSPSGPQAHSGEFSAIGVAVRSPARFSPWAPRFRPSPRLTMVLVAGRMIIGAGVGIAAVAAPIYAARACARFMARPFRLRLALSSFRLCLTGMSRSSCRR